MDVRVGGKYLWCMRSPEGQDFWTAGEFREVVAPERLVYTDNFADEHGNPVPPSYYGMSDDIPDGDGGDGDAGRTRPARQ